LHVLFNAGVQKADIGNAVDNDLAVQFQQQAQHMLKKRKLKKKPRKLKKKQQPDLAHYSDNSTIV
ncbi:MAG: hypothetical protein WCI04_05315, partial [archaeon]